jgi:uncharacterized membrane protein
MKFAVSLMFVLAVAFAGFTLQQSGTKEKIKSGDKNDSGEAPISFSKDVFPIIKKHCLPCHASDSDNKSELVLESYNDIMTGGKHGSPIVPGKGSESLIVQKVGPNPPFGRQMPVMSRTKLTDGQVDTLTMWIDQGAKKN